MRHKSQWMQVIMTVWTYMATMLASPGIVPCGWHPFGDLESSGQSTTSIMSDPKGGHRSRNDVAHNDQVARRTADEDVYLMMGNNLQRTVDSNRTVAESWNEALRQAHKPRWCRKCNAWKPPRCHHCSVSGRCVLKMDHYCVSRSIVFLIMVSSSCNAYHIYDFDKVQYNVS